MRLAFYVTACVVLASVASGLAQPAGVTFALPQPADAGAHAELAIDDSRPPTGVAFDAASAAEAALDQADLLPAAAWELAELAAALGPDVEAAFRFVRDAIALDPYDGVLRGAEGTLAARAGGSWDRALLLRALLAAGGHGTRLAWTDEVTGSARLGDLSAPEPLPAPDSRTWTLDLERVRARATRDFALVSLALADAGVHVGGAPRSAGDAAAGTHAWVQVQTAEGSWLDLDPSQAEPGLVMSPATATADAAPAEAHHVVTLRVVAEVLEDGIVADQLVLEQRLLAVSAAAQDVWLYFQPDAGGIGGTIADLFEGKSYVPVLMVDDATTAGVPFALGGGGGDDFFGGFLGGGGPELTRLVLELEASGPGLEPVTARRTLLDRVAPADRAAGTIMSELLEPLPEDGVPTALAALHHVMVSTGGANPREHAIARAFAVTFAATELAGSASGDYPLADVLLPLAVADDTLVVAAERGIVDGLRSTDARAYVARPRVYLSTLEPLAGEQGATAMTVDLALDGVSFVTAGETVDTAALQRWYGALQSALETELARARFRAVDAGTGGVRSLSTAMSDARDAGAALTVIGPGDGGVVSAAAAALRGALTAGNLAVVVGDAARGGGFWSIDPATGTTRSVMEPGLRVGFTWGRNYTNASSGGPRWVIDPETGNTLGYERDGRFYRYGRKPPSRCSGGQEYVMLLGCVSIPAGMTLGMTYGVIVTAIVSWATAVIELALLL